MIAILQAVVYELYWYLLIWFDLIYNDWLWGMPRFPSIHIGALLLGICPIQPCRDLAHTLSSGLTLVWKLGESRVRFSKLLGEIYEWPFLVVNTAKFLNELLFSNFIKINIIIHKSANMQSNSLESVLMSYLFTLYDITLFHGDPQPPHRPPRRSGRRDTPNHHDWPPLSLSSHLEAALNKLS